MDTNYQKKEAIIFGINESETLAQEIALLADLKFSKPNKITFSDGEVLLKSEITVRRKIAIIVSSFANIINHNNILDTLIFIDSLKRADASEIILVLTYYGYARQDRKEAARHPISAKLIANILQVSGITKIITLDLHNPSIQGFFDISIDDIKGQFAFAPFLLKENSNNMVVVSPDHGGATRARKLAELLGAGEIAIVDKRRKNTNQTEIFGILGNVKDKNIIIIDDIIDTGSTIIQAAGMLKEKGAKKVMVVATHGVFSKGFEIFEQNSWISKIIVTNSIDQSRFANFSKHKFINISSLLAKVIKKHLKSESISSLYQEICENINAQIYNKNKNT